MLHDIGMRGETLCKGRKAHDSVYLWHTDRNLFEIPGQILTSKYV